MAAEYIPTTPSKPNTARLHQALRAFREARAILGQEVGTMIAMRNGADNPADAANYSLVAYHYGVEAGGYATANAAARKMFLESEALLGTVDDSDAAVAQLCRFLGI